MFMASNAALEGSSSVWLVDNGCSNHMIGEKRLFKKLDESQKMSVLLGNDKDMEMFEVGIVAISTKNGEFKQLHGVQLVPRLVHNLLNVGQ